VTAAGRIQLKHPDGKRAPSIPRDHYTLVRRLVLAAVPPNATGISWVDLRGAVDEKLGRSLGDANNWWSIHAVKLHLEAIGEIRRISESPQRLVRGTTR
jgi:hypothetical protein